MRCRRTPRAASQGGGGAPPPRSFLGSELDRVRVGARIEQALLTVVPADPVVLDAAEVAHLENLALLPEVAEVRAIHDDLVTDACFHGVFLCSSTVVSCGRHTKGSPR